MTGASGFPGAQGERWDGFELELGMSSVMLALSCWLYNPVASRRNMGGSGLSICMSQKDIATASFFSDYAIWLMGS